MYKALTLPRTRKQAIVEDPSTSDTVSSLKPTPSLSPNVIRKQRGKAKSGGAVGRTLLSRSSPKAAKRQFRSIIKGGRNLISFRNKNESAPIAVLDLQRNASTRRASAGGGDDETDVAAAIDSSPSEDWSVKTTCERVKKISVAESVYRNDDDDGGGGSGGSGSGGDENRTDVKSIISEQDAFLDASSVPSPTAELGDFSSAPSFRLGRKTSNALKEEIIRKTTCDNAAYILSKMVCTERMINGQDRSASNKNDLLFKILVIGELGTGKTSIIKRYVHQFFSQHYRATIGVDFALKVLAWDTNTTIRLQLWDIAGQERFGNMTRVYYKEAVGALIVFDVTRQGTFDAVNKWKQDLDSKVQLPDGETIPCVLLANKCDQPKEGIVSNQHKMDEFCKENHFVGWFETSAKENVNIDEAANCLVSKIIQNDMKRHLEKETVNGTGVISIDMDRKDTKRKLCNYC